jgi:hypothetical protein
MKVCIYTVEKVLNRAIQAYQHPQNHEMRHRDAVQYTLHIEQAS